MKPLFTLHAGEYLTGCEIERQFGSKVNLWVPVKDEGIDILVTDRDNKRMVSLQVKYSRDFARIARDNHKRKQLRSVGWWTFKRSKIQKSKADFWVLLTYDGFGKESDFIIIPPRVLLSIYDKTNRKKEIIQSYVCITLDRKIAFEGRDLSNDQLNDIIDGRKNPNIRDLKKYLSNWSLIVKGLRIR